MFLEEDDEISTARWQEASEKLKIILSILVQDSEVPFLLLWVSMDEHIVVFVHVNPENGHEWENYE